MKADAWEGGHRVPFIAHWPRCITSAQVSANPVVLTDLYRTIANITKVTVPENAGEDSFDFTAHLLGAKDVLQPHRDHMVHHSHKGLFAIRIGSWKLIEGRTSGGFTRFKPPADAPAGQLYDLSKDPREAKNVYAQNPKIVKRLHTRLQGIKDAGRSNRN
jgi:arylsulfatase A-like enzyme